MLPTSSTQIAWEGLVYTTENNLETAVMVAATDMLKKFEEIPYTQHVQWDLENGETESRQF